MKGITIYRKDLGVRHLKPGITLDFYNNKYPTANAIECKEPSLKKLEEWEEKGRCKTPCGCSIEPDGECKHGNKSWLLIMGFI